MQSFSQAAREIFEHFHFEDFVQQLATANLLYQVVQRFASIDLNPGRISNFGIGIIFEGDEYIQQVSTGVTVSLHGQELNPESYGICKADMLIKGQLINATQRYSKMRKSLGSSQYVDEANSEAIVRAYGAFEEADESKIFPVDTFGYRRITIERPLRLNFQASPERLTRLTEEKVLQKLDESRQQALLSACQTLNPNTVYSSRDDSIKALKAALQPLDFKLGAPQLKAVLNALSERDSEADICTDKIKVMIEELSA